MIHAEVRTTPSLLGAVFECLGCSPMSCALECSTSFLGERLCSPAAGPGSAFCCRPSDPALTRDARAGVRVLVPRSMVPCNGTHTHTHPRTGLPRKNFRTRIGFRLGRAGGLPWGQHACRAHDCHNRHIGETCGTSLGVPFYLRLRCSGAGVHNWRHDHPHIHVVSRLCLLDMTSAPAQVGLARRQYDAGQPM